MPLSPGARVGPYEIVGAIGEGGMGQVYRARDPRLNRDVAIKALPDLFSADPERVARFEREAQLLAALNHPNIGGIYGLEESAGARYLVLELVPGESLAQRLTAGPVPLDDALAIARQAAEALEAAHEKGIIHRDLKPGNIMLTPEGQVKVLDFGLAKTMDGAEPGAPSSAPGLSPTFTSPAMTAVGLVIGTAAYMAPEQAKGRAADKRSDVWAFGCVLYELLTGTSAFAAEDVSDTLAAVLRADPDWTRLPQTTPPPIARLVRRCLQKDRKQRLPDISVARFEIDEWLAGGNRDGAAVRPPDRPRVAAIAAGAAVLAVAATAGIFRFILWPAPPLPAVARFEIRPPADTRVVVARAASGTDVAISRDGSRVVYRVTAGESTALAVRRLDESESTMLPGTRFSSGPSLSPTGDRVAFHGQGKLQVLVIGASAPSTICDLPGQVTGTRWLNGDTIVVAANGSLFSVPARGGTPQPLAQPDAAETSFAFPELTEDGKAVLFTLQKEGRRHIAARKMGSQEQHVVIENASYPRIAQGRVMFVQGGQLLAAEFDAARLRLAGAPTPLNEVVVQKYNGAATFDVSANGTFAGVSGFTAYTSRFVWRTRDGAVAGSAGPAELEYPRYPRISPDGRRLAASVGPSSGGHIWIFDLAGASQPLKLTFEDHNLWPTWTPNGVVFARMDPTSNEGPRLRIMSMPADASSLAAKVIVTLPDGGTSTSTVSPDGHSLLYAANNRNSGSDLMLKAMNSEAEPKPWLAEPFSEASPMFSPDGRSVAYVSHQTGSAEVWVRPFPGPGAPIRISPSGGRDPIWSRSGKELFYQEGAKLMAAAVTATTPEVRFATPRMLFQGGFVTYTDSTPRTYDVAADGRFLMIEDRPEKTPSMVTIVTGWSQTLPQR